jgi:hypothetical protein
MMTTHNLSIFSSLFRENTSKEMTSFNPITEIQTSSEGELVTISFYDRVFLFHSQWLHDAQVDDGSLKIATEVFIQIQGTALVQDVTIQGVGFKTFVNITWVNGKTSTFLAPWLEVFAPLVGKRLGWSSEALIEEDEGWLTNTPEIPETWYEEIFPDMSLATKSQIYDLLLRKNTAGIIKAVGLQNQWRNMEEQARTPSSPRS